MLDVSDSFSGSPLRHSTPGADLSHPNADVDGPLGGSSSSESVDVRSMKIVFGSSAAGIVVAGPPSGLCCPMLPESFCGGSSLSLTELQSRPMLVGSSEDAASHALASAFLCFRPPRLLFRRLGAAPALELSGALSGGGADCVGDRHGLSSGADHGSQGDTYPPLLARTPPAVEPPSCFRP